MVSSFVRTIGTVTLVSIFVLPSHLVLAAGINHAPKAAMEKASGAHEAKRQKCLSAYKAASATVKAAGKKAFMSHCITTR
jgi:hypothetical protein